MYLKLRFCILFTQIRKNLNKIKINLRNKLKISNPNLSRLFLNLNKKMSQLRLRFLNLEHKILNHHNKINLKIILISLNSHQSQDFKLLNSFNNLLLNQHLRPNSLILRLLRINQKIKFSQDRHHKQFTIIFQKRLLQFKELSQDWILVTEINPQLFNIPMFKQILKTITIKVKLKVI